jgi:hypothetical protein
MPQPRIDIAGLFSLVTDDWTPKKPWVVPQVDVLGVAAERTGHDLCRHEPVLSFVETKADGSATRDLQSKKSWVYSTSPGKKADVKPPESSLRAFVAPDSSVIGYAPLRDRILEINLPDGPVTNRKSMLDVLDLGAVSDGAGGQAAKKWLNAPLGGVVNTRFRLRSGTLEGLRTIEEDIPFRVDGAKKKKGDVVARICQIVRFRAQGVTGTLRVRIIDPEAKTVEELQFRLGCRLVISNFCGAGEDSEEKAGVDVLALYDLAPNPIPVEQRPIPHSAKPEKTKPGGSYCPPTKQVLA